MRRQEIIIEKGKDFLVVALPTITELFDHGFISRSGKSFVYREWSVDKKTLKGYNSFRFRADLIKGRILNDRSRHFHKSHVVSYEFTNFKGVLLPCIKISISKKLVPQGT